VARTRAVRAGSAATAGAGDWLATGAGVGGVGACSGYATIFAATVASGRGVLATVPTGLAAAIPGAAGDAAAGGATARALPAGDAATAAGDGAPEAAGDGAPEAAGDGAPEAAGDGAPEAAGDAGTAPARATLRPNPATAGNTSAVLVPASARSLACACCRLVACALTAPCGCVYAGACGIVRPPVPLVAPQPASAATASDAAPDRTRERNFIPRNVRRATREHSGGARP